MTTFLWSGLGDGIPTRAIDPAHRLFLPTEFSISS